MHACCPPLTSALCVQRPVSRQRSREVARYTHKLQSPDPGLSWGYNADVVVPNPFIFRYDSCYQTLFAAHMLRNNRPCTTWKSLNRSSQDDRVGCSFGSYAGFPKEAYSVGCQGSPHILLHYNLSQSQYFASSTTCVDE
jgi:hypothetical protein